MGQRAHCVRGKDFDRAQGVRPALEPAARSGWLHGRRQGRDRSRCRSGEGRSTRGGVGTPVVSASSFTAMVVVRALSQFQFEGSVMKVLSISSLIVLAALAACSTTGNAK